MVGYTVGKGKKALPDNKRKKLLERFFLGPMPKYVEARVEKEFPGEFGDRGSEQRLKRMAHVIADNTINFKLNDPERYRFAIAHWENDLAYLKKSFYDKGRHSFPWPTTDPE